MRRQGKCQSWIRRTVELAGIEGLRFHDTRHEACSRLGQIVPDMLHLSRITGHRDPRMLRRYFTRRRRKWSAGSMRPRMLGRSTPARRARRALPVDPVYDLTAQLRS